MRRKFGKMHFKVLMVTLIIFMVIITKGIPTIKPVEGEKNSLIEDKSKEPLLYSSLNFGETPSRLEPCDVNREKTIIDTIPFSEDILRDADLVCMATVINTYKEHLCYCLKQTDVYEVRIDKIYYSEDKVKEGEIIKIENFNSCNSDIELLNVGIVKDHQYIFPIRKTGLRIVDNGELGRYGIVCPYVNRIEVTKNNEYVFHGGWKSLIDENTVDVILDSEKDNSEELLYMKQIKLRRDDGFEGDLITLIQRYKDKELKNTNIDEEDVMAVVWNQLEVKDIDFIRDGSTLKKITINDVMGTYMSDKTYIGKEVYIIDFQTTRKVIPNNLIVYASLEDYKIIGRGAVD